MKHVPAFIDFLENEVNLNQTRLDLLKKRLDTISNYLRESELLKKNFKCVKPQGSYAHKTIIKPQSNKEFDADILIYLNEFPDWEPKDYINNIYDLFKDNGNYENIVHRKTRCILLDYSGDFHIDIVPCIKDDDNYYILNRNENKREETDGDGYAEWLKNKNAVVQTNQLIKIIRLAKYLRDIKGNFTVKSILLTTLFGNQINLSEHIDNFKDVPTSLKTLFNRLNDFLQKHSKMPIIKNPVLETEEFCRHWDQDKYSNFRDKFKYYTDKINEAFVQTDRDESIKKWREIFNDNFGKSKETATVESNVVIPTKPSRPWKVIG